MISTRNTHSTKSLLFLFIALGISAATYSGCSKGFSGDPLANSRPEVRFVNVPPDSSVFSANPIINWIGTDIDGRIVEYRYAVVVASAIPAGMSPDEYARDSIPSSDWVVKPVTLDDPASRDTVALTADILNPVTVVVQQFLFLLAVDDKGVASAIVYRSFGRNDHFPNTRLVPPLPPGGAFVNVSQVRFQQGGIPLDWSGSDDLDFPGSEEGVPLEFEWKFYGPYTQAESTLIMDSFLVKVFVTNTKTYNLDETLVDTAFDFTQADTVIDTIIFNPIDSTVDTTFGAITVKIDSITTLIIDTATSAAKGLEGFGVFETTVDLDKVDSLDSPNNSRLLRSSFNPVTGDSWTSDRAVRFFDVFRDDPTVTPDSPADTTRQNSFLFWVRARDDAFVPDPAPSFTLLPVINPRHERDLLIVTFNGATRTKNHNGVYMPCQGGDINAIAAATESYTRAKMTFANYLNGWIDGYSGPNETYGFDYGSFDPCGEDFLVLPYEKRFPKNKCAREKVFATSPDFLNLSAFASAYSATLRDILKHKVVIYLKENLQKEFGFGQELGNPTQFLVQGLLSGNNYWVMGRSPFQEKNPLSDIALFPYQYGVSTTSKGLSPIYAQLFGIQGGFESSWVGMAGQREVASHPVLGKLPPVRSEDFIGAVPSELVSSADFPELRLDPLRLDTMLHWTDSMICQIDRNFKTQHFPFMDSIGALPDVGFTIPLTSAGTETLYLYRSRFGEAKYPFHDLDFGDMQGTVVAVRLDGGFFRTSHWQFTPMPLDSASFQPAFNSMMDWLFARPWGGPGGGQTAQPVNPPSEKYASKYIELSQTVESARLQLLDEVFGGKRYFKNQLEFEQQYKDYNLMKELEAAAQEESF